MAKNHLPILCIWMSLCLLGCGEPRRAPEVFELPWGYEGWVQVEYQNPDCPPLQSREGKRVVRIATDGTACTSSEYVRGVAKDEFYWTGKATKRLESFREVWPGGTLGDERPTYMVFVGSKREHERAKKPWEVSRAARGEEP